MDSPTVRLSSACISPGYDKSIASYCFGDANDEERNRLESHLLECQYCWSEVRRLDAIIQQLATHADTQLDREVIAMIGTSSLLDRPFGGHWAYAIVAAILYGL